MENNKNIKPVRYILNSPVLTSYGNWNFSGPVGIEQARAFVADGFVSAIGHAGSAELLSQVLGVKIPVNRLQVTMSAGDCALVLRVLSRLPEGAILDIDTLLATPYELSFLKKEY